MLQLIEFFKLIADETRLRILILLAQENLYVCQICGILNLSQPKVSKHLAKLRELGYVMNEKKEKFILYSLNLNLKDEGIVSLIGDIITNLDKYPQLNEDKKRIINKSIYFNQCKTNNEQ